MNKESYNDRLKILNKEHKTKTDALARECALSNNKVRLNDIVVDHYQTVRVDKIKVAIGTSYEIPSCVYCGVLLKKDMTPRKRPELAHVHQSNLEKIVPFEEVKQ